MANLTDNGSTGWYTIGPGNSAIAEASGDFGTGTVVVEMRSSVDSSTAITVQYPTGVDGTSEFAVVVPNHSGIPREYRLTLSGATSPDIDCTIE